MKGGSETKVTNGNFNGSLGNTISIDTNVYTYEIYWTNSKVWFVIGDEILHTVSATTTTWANTMSFYTGMDNVNSGDLDTNQLMYCRVLSIARLGPLLSQPRGVYQSGTVAARVLKYGPGSVHGIAISGVANNAVVTLWDNTAASGTTLWSTGSQGSNAVPYSINLHGIAFANGLTLSIAAAAANATVMYE